MKYIRENKLKGLFKKGLCGLLAIIMLITAFPLQAIAAQLNYDDIGGQKSTYINNVDPVTPGKTDNATKYIKDPEMPEIYTLRTDYMVKKNGDWKINYQPYVASVGANATPDEQAKVKKTINLPDLKGYEKAQESFDITYKSIVDAAKSGQQTGDTWQKNQDFKYRPKENYINVKHVFQSLTDFNEYGPKDGDTDAIYTTAKGKTGSLLEVTSLPNSSIEGFEPETDILSTIVPEDTRDFEIEYRYHRKDYDVNYDTVGGNAIPSRRLYYGQKIPRVETPTKNGSVFLGWKPSVDLVGELNSIETTFKKGEIINDATGKPIFDLNAKLKMPAQDITFTAVWKDAPKADYLIQFWTEKPDYDDKDGTLPLRERYDYIGSRRIEDADTGSRPDLTNLPIDGITFPDLNDGRLEKAQNNPKEFARYYFLNNKLTEKQNASKEDPSVQKSVLSTGETVYNVYYDRRVYTLYFTSINDYNDPWAYWPIITRNGQVLGKEGDPYKVNVRFNQSLDKIWPKDAEVSGLPKGDSTNPTGDDGLIGWTINNNVHFLIFRDTPPYRLSAEDFIDPEDVMGTDDYSGQGHADKIPIGKNKEKDRGEYEISLGASYMDTAIAYHIDIIKDDFNGKEQIDYDLSYWKSDTNTYDYDFILPHLQGFELKEPTRKAILIGNEKVGDVEKTFDELNEERNAITPFRSDADKIQYIDRFPWSTSKETSPDGTLVDKSFKGKNAYNYANYTRNKYKLKLNNDPKTIKNDNEYVLNKDMFDVYYEMPLNDLKLDTNNVPKKPDWVPENWEFKGWATDPAGENLLKDGKETKLHYDQFLFAKWGEPDYKWKVTIDPDGGNLKDIKLDDLIIKEKANQDLTEVATKLPNEGSKQIFEVNHRAKLKRLPIPRRKGHDFLGWQLIRYNEDDSVDTSYIDEYGVPELYAFGNDLVTDVYLKAIWLSNDKIDIPVYHHFLDKDGNEIESLKVEKVIDDARVGYYTAASASEQNQEWLLMPKEELEALADNNPVKIQYKEYNEIHPFNNADYHSLKVEPKKILNKEGQEVDNPKAKYNEFHFFYRRFKTRDYKVNYLDKKAQAEIEKIIKSTDTVDAKKEAIKAIVKDNSIIAQEEVVSRNRHYDARNYRHIPGWKLASDPQQQLFYDVDEKTGEFKGINGTGLDEIFFYYEDVRVIDVPKDDPVPDGYVRITFKADKGGAFTDKDGNSKTELYYDVIEGLKSDLLVVPQELKEGTDKEEGKYYITPDNGKTFTKWDEKPLLNDNTIIDREYTFTAYFDWSGLSAKGLVTTEAFKDPNNTWTNDFAPKIEDLKKQLEWREKDQVKPLPAGTEIKFYDEAGNELTTDDQVYNLVKEMNKADKDQLVRTVNVKAKVTFPDKKEPQELDIPVKVYKNVYEALTTGEKPLFLSEAEKGDLKDITGNYVKVTVNPTGKPGEKDSKIYYVNPKAWVEIPEITLTEDEKRELGFTHWSADKDEQNEDGAYDFNKRHKFTEDTVISPGFEKDVVEQIDPDKKPPVPESYVKVIVKTTDKATDDTAFEKTFWVNSTKEVTIDVANPTGKTLPADPTKVGAVGYTMKFSKWQSEEDTQRTWEDKIVGKFEKETTIVAKYSVTPEEIKDQLPKTDTVHTPEGKTPTVDEIKDKITPPDGKTIKNVTIVEEPDVTNPGNTTVKVIVEYDDGSSVGTNDKPVEIKVEVHKNIIPAGPNGEKPEGALENYVKVIFKAGTGGKLEGTLTGNFIYYVSPEVEVDMTEVARDIKKTPDTGYFVNGEKWNNKDNKKLKGTFTEKETVFEFVFDKSTDIVEKTDDSVKKPDGYVTVTFRAEAHGKLEGDKTEKIYYVNPKAGIKLVELADGQTAEEKQLAVPKTVADKNYVFEKWYEAIDKNNPVTNNLEYVARFVKDGVTLTYKAGGAEGTVPEAVTVAQGTSVRLASAAGLTKKDAKFAGWKIGDKTYQVGDLVTLEESKTAVAQWTNDKNIIEYDPSDPITRPDDTYVRVTFEADDGLKLTESKAYYVKKDANITLAELAKPAYDEKTGYKFNKWDKEDTLTIAGDTVVKALSTKLDNVIPENKDDGTPNDKPEGYKEVVFVADANGKLEGVTKFFVNPDEYVTINPPKAVGNTGYEFGSWDKNATIPTVYKDEVTTITASFNQIKDVIPKTKDNDSEKPAGYKTVTFVIEGEGGKIVDGETITYFVDPNRQVTIQPPTTNADTGYKFNAWDKNTTTPTSYAVDTTVKGTFSKLEDIIPATDDNPKPDGYVTVTFDKGEHGKDIAGQRVYYVNPKANISLGNEKIVKPTVSPETGWKANGWDKEDTQPITKDLTVTAKYAPIDDVIPKTQDDESDKPEGYITVTFVKGDHGKELTGQAVYYVNPNKAVVLEGKAPTAVPNKGYTFARWDTSIDKDIQYKDGDKITALYNEPGNISETEVAGYVKVEFKQGQHGNLDGKTEYWIKPGVEVNIPAPTVKPNVGYKFDKWDRGLTVTLKANDPTYVITAEYEDLENIIPQQKTDGSDKPEGYHTVTFKSVNGSLEGTTTYYVKPNVEVDLTDTANAITKKADVGYTAEGGTWSPAITKQQYTANETYTFNFAKLGDVIPKTTDDESEKPEGYVTVKFIPTANAQDPTEKVYYVNPKVNVTLPIADPVGKEVTDQSGTNYTFNFKLWTVTRGTVATWDKGTQVSGVFIQDTDITAKYNVNAETLINGPVPKDNVVTAKGDVPKPEDLIKNIFDPNDPNNKDNLPKGTTFTYTNDGTPDVSNPGETTAKVEVKYPDGKTSVVEVPIKVVDHVVPQTGGENGQKPLVPDSYVKVTVDTTNNATPNTKFVKVFWVKPNVEVTIPDILAPTGKVVEEGGVTKTNRFVKWQLVGSDPAKFYETEITDTFTKDETIVATYEFDKNVEPKGKDDQWIPQGSNPSPKDFIENPYDDNDPNNPNNLPPGTKFEFVPGTEPNTTEPGTDKTTTIKVIYPNGEVKEVPVKYNVTGDVVEQPDPNDPTTKPAVPDNYVKVTVIPTEKAKDETNRVFWVNPEKVVTIPVNSPEVKDELQNDRWRFSRWDTPLTGTFTSETKITAIYVVEAAPIVPQPNVKYVITDVGVQPTKDKYLEKITPPTGKDIDNIDIIEQPDVNKKGVSSATIKVTYTDGTSVTVKMDVIVQDKYVPPTPDKPDDPYYPERPDYPYYPERPYYPLRPEVRYETIIQEKVVKVPIIDNAYFKEVRYMQGFNGDFRPKDGLTRAEAAQILANALVEDGYKYNPNFKLSYKDIGEAWYTRAVKIVTEANVFEGYDDGNFKPQDKITRNEWIATLKRFQEIGDASGNHMNLRDGHWAMSEIEAAYNEGWLKIYSDGLATYKGDEFIPREEVAAVSNKAFKRVLDKTYIRNNEKSLISYKDVNKDMWSYEDILCASNTFLYKNDLYRAHWIKEDKNVFNIDTKDLNIVQAKFQRNPR